MLEIQNNYIVFHDVSYVTQSFFIFYFIFLHKRHMGTMQVPVGLEPNGPIYTNNRDWLFLVLTYSQ